MLRTSLTHLADGQRLDWSASGLALDDTPLTPAIPGWWWRPGQYALAGLPDAEDIAVRAEAHGQFLGALQAAQIAWLDDPFHAARVRQRLYQLHVASAAGLTVPNTCVTTDVATAQAFTAEPTVGKCVTAGPGLAHETMPISADDLAGAAIFPTLLQRFITAAADLRIVSVGGIHVAFRRDREHDLVDWRTVDPGGRGFAPTTPPWLGMVTTLMTALGLTFAVSDWLEQPDGRPVFLEVNPGGKWHFLPGCIPAVPDAAAELLCP